MGRMWSRFLNSSTCSPMPFRVVERLVRHGYGFHRAPQYACSGVGIFSSIEFSSERLNGQDGCCSTAQAETGTMSCSDTCSAGDTVAAAALHASRPPASGHTRANPSLRSRFVPSTLDASFGQSQYRMTSRSRGNSSCLVTSSSRVSGMAPGIPGTSWRAPSERRSMIAGASPVASLSITCLAVTRGMR